MRITLVAILVLGFASAVRAGTTWSLESGPTNETFNGVSIGAAGYKILVGNSGAIVHVDGNQPAVQMPSGTVQDLFDVYVVDRDFAVAVGRDVGVIWDGTSWTQFLTDTMGTVFTSVWASPEKDVVIFNIPGNQFSFHRAYFPNTDTFRPGAFVSGFDIAYCGGSNDVKTIVANGSINNFDNNLAPAAGTEDSFGILFDNSASPLSLTAAWFPPGSCASRAAVPFDGFAIDNNRFFRRFDPNFGWQQLPVDGGSIPGDHTLTWLAGVGPNNVIAVGFKPNPGGGNDGVLWRWDGQLWSEDLSLPAATPGLTDVAAQFNFNDAIFTNGFEVFAQKIIPQFLDDYAEISGEGGSRVTTDRFQRAELANLDVRKRLLNEPPYSQGDKIRFAIEITNTGPGAVTEGRLEENLISFGGMPGSQDVSYLTDDCASIDLPGRRSSEFTLGAGESMTCTFEFLVPPDVKPDFNNTATVYSRDKTNIQQRSISSVGRRNIAQ